MITDLHHVAVLTSRLEDVLEYYVRLFGSGEPQIVNIDNEEMRFRSAMLPIGPRGATFLQVMEPHRGPGVQELEKGGEGTVLEVAFQDDDIDRFHDHLVEIGGYAVDMAGTQLTEKYITSKFGNRYFFVPPYLARGTRIEIVQVMSPPANRTQPGGSSHATAGPTQ